MVPNLISTKKEISLGLHNIKIIVGSTSGTRVWSIGKFSFEKRSYFEQDISKTNNCNSPLDGINFLFLQLQTERYFFVVHCDRH